MDFGVALSELRRDNQLARQGWCGKGMWVALQAPTGSSKMTLPYLYMRTAQGDFVPWLASQTDLLAHDWFVITS